MNRDTVRHFAVHFLLPVAGIVACSLGALVGGMLWLTSLQNRFEGIKEKERVAAAFASRLEAMDATIKVFSVWDDAVKNLVIKLDRNWADVNESQYVFDQYGFESTFILDPAGRPVYAYLNGKRTIAAPGAILGAGYRSAAERVLSARSAKRIALTGLSRSSRGPVIFGISKIMPHSTTIDTKGLDPRYLVMAKLIDPKLLHQLSEISNHARLSYGAAPLPGQGSWSLNNVDGRSIGFLNWRSGEPGTTLRRSSEPWLAVLILFVVTLAGSVIFYAWQGTKQLSASETKALHLASSDALTGLPNHRYFMSHLLELSRRSKPFSLLYLDLDRFKQINDTYGHGVGDNVLCRTAERLQRAIPTGAFLARLGGDEFAITLKDSHSHSQLELIARRIVAAVREPFEFGGEPATIGVSIGITESQQGDHDEVIRHADTAMYLAKAERGDGWRFYDPSLDEGRNELKQLEADLKRAIATGQIFVVFQPIVGAKDGRITAVEALARWTHPTRGPISPDVFIPMAEESGLIVELGQHILRLACTAARDWPFDLAVNLSPAQFWNRNLVEEVIATLAECRFPPARLEFGITETYLLRRPDQAAAIIDQLRSHGIRIALDDFGTGYASIGYLRRFALDLVKIDRSLVEAVSHDSSAINVLVAIISLCGALNLPILAEGVESKGQADLLTASGCHYLQGWHFGYPMSADDISSLALRLKIAA